MDKSDRALQLMHRARMATDPETPRFSDCFRMATIRPEYFDMLRVVKENFIL